MGKCKNCTKQKKADNCIACKIEAEQKLEAAEEKLAAIEKQAESTCRNDLRENIIKIIRA